KFSFNNTSTKAEEDDAYAEFKMRDRGDIFNDAESGIFSNDSHDRRAEKKRRKDAEKSIKRADKQKKKTKSSSNDDWQNDDFWN
ncbi:MAG: hypothetical protein IJL87_03185, partial [Clostridia bacterium]|nr:hypothetical protein [Clostridia bacterium]